MSGAPDWQDGECCFRCRTQFTLVARKHHCRNCGNIFCAKCSSQQIPLPKLNIERNVRVCDTCYEKITSKNEDPLDAALSSKEKQEQTMAKSTSSKSSTSKKQASNNASAPSEQELKEEEEFQLALALSLSETPTKVSFPDCRSFEISNLPTVQNNKQTPSTSSSSSIIPASTSSAVATNSVNHSAKLNGTSPQRAQTDSAISMANNVDQYVVQNDSPAMQQQIQKQPQFQQPEFHIPERDLETFRYVGEVQSTLEVFNNRLESCKLRNRPVANDAAIQSLFLKLSAEFQPKLAEFIKTYENERADYEGLQDKLSQIADARAALDALREEHQERVRQQAAEAERQRQSQLATKLEAMRQKKSEMMQYQRELALQRIREQEMSLLQQQPATAQSYQVPQASGQQQIISGQTQFAPMQQMHNPMQSTMIQQSSVTMHQDWQQSPFQESAHYASVPQTNYDSTQQSIGYQQQMAIGQQPYVSAPPPPPPTIDRVAIAQLERQFLPNAKPEEDAPLISFDD